MNLQVRGQQRLEQRLLPQMLQSIEVLQLATAELMSLVDHELQHNETLELAPPAESETVADAVDAAAAAVVSDWETPGVRPTNDSVDSLRAFLEMQPAHVDSLVDHVRLQAAFRGVPEPLAGAIVQLAESLDERGLLPLPLGEVAASTGLEIDLLEEARQELAMFDPRGLGAASAVEAMLAQAADDPDLAIIESILTRHLDALARNKRPQVARELEIGLDDLEQVIDRMRGLVPAPAAPFYEASEPAITPDAHAWLEGGVVQVALADAMPVLTVSSTYEALLSDRTQSAELRDYLRAKVRAARDLIGAISMRKRTLLRVVVAVMQHQQAFLAQGRAALRSLRMTDLAQQLGLHASTISRAIAGKHVATAQGTVTLRDFFDGGRESGPAGDRGHARGAIAQRIRDLIAAEDCRNPLSDEALVEQLRAMGIHAARRTVAKFRCELDVPSSYQRRRHGGTRK